MILFSNTYGQASMDLFSFNGNLTDYKHRLNSFESNSANHIYKGDWQLSASFNSILGDNPSNSLLALSLGKAIENHYFYVRYSPGLTAQFRFLNASTITTENDVEVESELLTDLTYSENFGFGYSYKFTDNFSIGGSLRYFTQKFDEQIPLIILTSDSVNYISTKSVVTEINVWQGDLGLNYNLNDDLSFSLSSHNLFSFKEQDTSSIYGMNFNKGFIAGAAYRLSSNFSANFNYEMNGSFNLSGSHNFNFLNGKIGYEIALMHDKYQAPFISAVLPSINYTNEILSLTLKYVKYTSDRNKAFSLSDFNNDGINNIINNKYSPDKLILNLNIALSFVPDKNVRFVEIEYVENIYPTLIDEYIDKPFAKAKVINLTNKAVNVKPSSFIENLNSDIIHSPSINILGNDTAEVYFYTVIEDTDELINKSILSSVNFYLTTSGSNYDDEIEKPILLYDKNSWNGDVSSLKYFVYADLNKSEKYAKEVLYDNKTILDETDENEKIFSTVKLLFNNFVKQLQYVSDPRSNIERVQLPMETLNIKGGDCDDLSVSFASILESIGIQTAFIDYKEEPVNHVNLLVNTKIHPSERKRITNNDKRVFIRKNNLGNEEIWIPVETTVLTNFEEAWESGSEKFYKSAVTDFGLAKGSVKIIDIL